MKQYKAFLNEGTKIRLSKLKIASPIIISEYELDLLIDSNKIPKTSQDGELYEIEYKDLEMVTTLD
jgi:hypothetical protein